MLENRYFLKLFNTNVVAVIDTVLTTMAYVRTKIVELHDVQRLALPSSISIFCRKLVRT